MFRPVWMALPLLVACAPAQPFDGPLWDAENEELRTDHEGPFVAVVTHTRVKKGEVSLFNSHVDGIVDQLSTQPGFVGSSLKGQVFGRERWTLTVWEDPQALVAFRDVGAHSQAMADQDDVVDQVYYAYWDLDRAAIPPTWDEALERLAEVEPEDPWAE